MHANLKTAEESAIALRYPKGSPLLARYLEANGIKSYRVSRHSLGERGWQVWACLSDDVDAFSVGGFPTDFKRRGDARRFAIVLSQHTGLPVIDETRAHIASVKY